MTPLTLFTLGSIAGYAVTVVRRDARPQDAVGSSTALAVTLSNGTNTYEASVTEDNNGDAPRYARFTGLALVNAFAAIGGSVTLGAPGQSPVASADPNGQGAYTRVATLTPGTPVPPGRGVFVSAAGPVKLKLSGGGTLVVSDPTSGSGTKFDHLAVVDADVSGATNATVQILY